MAPKWVAFVASFEQDNLGLGYIASMLVEAGYRVHFMDIREDRESIRRQIVNLNPVAVGFSVIFQYHIQDVSEMIDYLREGGIRCHFCAGGHFPTFRYREILEAVEGLDSICLFEGEYTFLELVNALSRGDSWETIRGLSLRRDGQPVANPARPMERDLDLLPLPVRRPHWRSILAKRVVTILAGRGCVYNCSFCSVRAFYSQPVGPVKRVRKPELVVREMELLHKEKGCSIFLFQDDDFPVAGRSGRDWSHRFCRELAKRGLADRVIWKISCRPDEIDRDLFTKMKSAGLAFVYLGIETGTETGLKALNKRLRVEDSIEALAVLRELGLHVEFGFMLFDPSSTLRSVRDNLRFLGEICADGSTPVTFCKMLPYAGTPIEKELIETGRLKGVAGYEDYDFLDSTLDHLHANMLACFSTWINDRSGVNSLLRTAFLHLRVFARYGDSPAKKAIMEKELVKICAGSNRFLLRTARRLLRLYETGEWIENDDRRDAITNAVADRHAEYALAIQRWLDDIRGMVPEGADLAPESAPLPISQEPGS